MVEVSERPTWIYYMHSLMIQGVGTKSCSDAKTSSYNITITTMDRRYEALQSVESVTLEYRNKE